MVSRTGLAALLGILVVVVISSSLVIFQSKQESKTLENPYILTADAQSGRVITMHITGIQGISADESIALETAEWHTGYDTSSVVGSQAEGANADNTGRIKVRFCWDRDGDKQSDSSCWIRISTAWAGKTWGAITIPRIGQEIIVDFLEGDPDHPIIIGKIFGKNPAIISNHYKLSDQRPTMETVISPSIIQWQFKDLQTGETFCRGVDSTKHVLLECKQILQ